MIAGHTRRRREFAALLTAFMVVASLLATAEPSRADGTETLGVPSIPISPGTGLIAAGTGMVAQPSDVTLVVPVGATVQQVILYWEGMMREDVLGDDTILVDGTEVTGTLIGGPTRFFQQAHTSTFRADITGLGLIGAGANTLTLDGLDFTRRSNGAGLLVIYDDGTASASIDVRDGNDTAFINFAAPQDSTVPQTFTFDAASSDRTGNLGMFFSSVVGRNGAQRASSIEVTSGGVTTLYSNLLDNTDGEEWDTLNLTVTIPAGATSMTVQALSRDDLGTGLLEASFVWIGAGLSVPPGDEPQPGIDIEKLTNGADADGANDADVPQIAPGAAVTWTYLVTNTGDTPFNQADVTVADDIPGVNPVFDPASDSGSDGVLSPGETWTYTAQGTAQDLLIPGPGTVVVDGCNPDGTQVPGDRATYENIGTVSVPDASDSDPSHYCNPPEPGIDIEKATNGEDADTPTGPFIPVGDPVTWTYEVTNTADADLVNVTVTDDQGVVVTCPQDTLAVGESMTCTANGIAEAGQYANVGSVTGDPPTGPSVTDSDPSHHFGADPSIDIEKATNGEDADTPTGPFIPMGDPVTWTYEVTNTGNVALVDVNVTDDQGVAVTCPQDTLAVGESMTCTANGIAEAGQYANLGNVTGTPPVGPDVTDDDPSHYFGEEAEGICLVIIDEDSIDNGVSTIEAVAASHGIEPDVLVNDDRPTETGNPWLVWSEQFAGDVVLLPTGQVDDEGWFALPDDTPWSLQDFVDGTVPQSELDKIDDVMPIRNQELARLVGETCVAVVYDSDISMNYEPINASLQGARYGLFAFTILDVVLPGTIPESESDTSLYDVLIEVESPVQWTDRFDVPIHDHEPDSIEIDRARYSDAFGIVQVYASSDSFDGNSVMTVSVDGFVFEAPMTYNAAAGRYEYVVNTGGVDLDGARVSVQNDHGGAYNDTVD